MHESKPSALWGLAVSAVFLVVIFNVMVAIQEPAEEQEPPVEVVKEDPICQGVKASNPLAVFTDTRQDVAVSYTTRTGSTLIVNIMVTNAGDRPHLMPSFHLADDQGCVHSRSASARVDNEIRILQRVNPGTTVIGNVPFDVPEDRQYALMVDGSQFIRVEELGR